MESCTKRQELQSYLETFFWTAGPFWNNGIFRGRCSLKLVLEQRQANWTDAGFVLDSKLVWRGMVLLFFRDLPVFSMLTGLGS